MPPSYSSWNDRTNEFKSLTINLNKDESTNRKSNTSCTSTINPEIKPIIKAISSLTDKTRKSVIPTITEIQRLITKNSEEFIHNMTTAERNKFSQDINSSLNISTSSISKLENEVKNLFYRRINSGQNNQNNGPFLQKYPSYCEHYTKIFGLIKKYVVQVSNLWQNLQKRYQSNKQMINRSRTLADVGLVARHKQKLVALEETMEDIVKDNNKEESSNLPTKTAINQDLDLNPDENTPNPLELTQNTSFNQEQNQLLAEFNTVETEVEQIGQTVTDIARLQEELNQQVFIQGDTIEEIETNIVNASDNVTKGNEELRSAIANNATTRAAMIFFLFMSSFLLLLLDYVSD